MARVQQIDLPPVSRIQAEQDALVLLKPATCDRCAIRREAIPFDQKWLEMAYAAGSAEMTARILAARMSEDINRCQSTATWLRSVAHELDELVLQAQIRRTVEIAAAQARELHRKRVSRMQKETELQIAAREALDALVLEEME